MDLDTSCRICFANNVKMHKLINTPLQEVYEKLTNVKLTKLWTSGAGALCTMCHARLQRCLAFQRAAARAEELLKQLYLDGVSLTQDVLSMVEPPLQRYVATSVEYVNIYSAGDTEEREMIKLEGTEREKIKQEGTEGEKVKLEGTERDNDSQDDVIEASAESSREELKLECEVDSGWEPEGAASDSEEDVPLHTLRSAPPRKKEERGDKKRYHECKLNAREVVLTYPQQQQGMAARAASPRYRRAAHRCQLCCRGFARRHAYTNHMRKHDESNGSHVCPLCFMRYKSARLLRAHTHSSHARQYVCNKCGHTANTRHQASDHERVHSGNYYECKLCGKQFYARTSYLTHVRAAHPGGAAHVCAACGERFVSEHGLRMHRARAHCRPGHEGDESSPESRFCASCDIQFLSRRAWATHVLGTPAHTQHAANTKECPICDKVVPGPMAVHLREHEKEFRRARPEPSEPAPEDKLACDQCPLSFSSRARLVAHTRRVHLGLKYDKNLVCEHCGKKCTSGATLRYHQRTHTGERPHGCAAPACGARFADTNQLRIHTRTHTGERPYACDTCGRRFAQKPALNRHYRVHTGAKPYTCELCSKSFSQSNSLHTHVRAVHLKLAGRKRSRASCTKRDGKTGDQLAATVKLDGE